MPKSLFSSPFATPVRYIAVELEARVTILNVRSEPKADVQLYPDKDKEGCVRTNVTTTRMMSGMAGPFRRTVASASNPSKTFLPESANY